MEAREAWRAKTSKVRCISIGSEEILSEEECNGLTQCVWDGESGWQECRSIASVSVICEAYLARTAGPGPRTRSGCISIGSEEECNGEADCVWKGEYESRKCRPFVRAGTRTGGGCATNSEEECNGDIEADCVWDGVYQYQGRQRKCRPFAHFSVICDAYHARTTAPPTTAPPKTAGQPIAPSLPTSSPTSFNCKGYADKASCNNVTPCVWEWVGKTEGRCTDELMQVVSQ